MKKGFTIVELLVVIVVIAILTAIVTVAYNGVSQNAKASSLKADLRNTATKIQLVKADTGEYPLTLSAANKVESETTTLTYQSDGSTFCLDATTTAAGGASFFMTHTGTIQEGLCPPGPATWTMVAAGSTHTLALASNGKLYAWGLNTNGQLGIGSTVTKTSPTEVPLTLPAGTTITQLSAGDSFSLALTSDGVVYGWGDSRQGQVGDGTSATSRTSPVLTAGMTGKTITQISAGGPHALALDSDGKVYSWGQNAQGQIGDGTTNARRTPAVVTSGVMAGKTITQISAGYYHSIVIGSTGAIYGWGSDNYGQTGSGTTTTTPRSTPIAATAGCVAGKTFTKLATGQYFTLALASNGTLCGWGQNSYGQVGNNGFTTPLATPVVSNSIAGKTVKQLSARGMQTLLLTTDGLVYGWGRNSSGELADSASSANRSSPFAISSVAPLTGKTVTQISSGDTFSYAITDGGELYAWGDNTSGRLGINNTTDTKILTPTAIPVPE